MLTYVCTVKIWSQKKINWVTHRWLFTCVLFQMFLLSDIHKIIFPKSWKLKDWLKKIAYEKESRPWKLKDWLKKNAYEKNPDPPVFHAWRYSIYAHIYL